MSHSWSAVGQRSANGVSDTGAEQLRSGVTVGLQGGRGSFNHRAWRQYGSVDRKATVRHFFDTASLLDSLRCGTVEFAQFAVKSGGEAVQESAIAVAEHLAHGESLHVAHTYRMITPYAVMVASDDENPITRIVGHPQALRESNNEIAELWPDATTHTSEDAYDPSLFVERVKAGGEPGGSAVLGSEDIAAEFGLRVLRVLSRSLSETVFVLVRTNRFD